MGLRVGYVPKAMSQNLSPFHAELLDFLEKEIHKRIETAAGHDPELHHFQEKIQGFRNSGSLPLQDVVENYQYLFTARGPLHLEKRLIEAFSDKEMGVRIYRGLPRLYRKLSPTDSKLKKHFTNLRTLLRLGAEKAICSVYEGMEHPRNAIVACQDAKHLGVLKRRFPNLQLCMKEEGKSYDLVVPKFGDYGSLESEEFHPESGNRALGLHFLEKGVAIQKALYRPSFAEIANPEILMWLFGTTTPGPSEIEEYLKSCHFYFADIESKVGRAVYLQALAKLHEADQKQIDICTPHSDWVAGDRFRILTASKMDEKDRFLLTSLSGEWVGVTKGFSDAVSANKAFFLDGQRYLLKDLLALAENRLGMHRSTLEVIRGMAKCMLHQKKEEGEWVEETDFQEVETIEEIALKIGSAMQDPDSLAGFKKLTRIIHEEHSFYDFLCHWVQRELCHQAYPTTKFIEEEIIHAFTLGKISLKAAIEHLKLRFAYGSGSL